MLRNRILFKNSYKEPHRGFSDANIEGSVRSVEWVQLWYGGPKFSTINIGSTNLNYENATGYSGYVGGLYKFGALENTSTSGIYPNSGILPTEYDTAYMNWGSNWRMPTYEELSVMSANTIATWCDGVNVKYIPSCSLPGIKIQGIGEYSDADIFIPAYGGFRPDGSSVNRGSAAYIWSSNATTSINAYRMACTKGTMFNFSSVDKTTRMSVRAILNEPNYILPVTNMLPPARANLWTCPYASDNELGYTSNKVPSNQHGLNLSTVKEDYETYYFINTPLHLNPTHIYYTRINVIHNCTQAGRSINYDIYWPLAEPPVYNSPTVSTTDWQTFSTIFIRSQFEEGDYIFRVDVNNRYYAFMANFSCSLLIDLTETYTNKGLPIPSKSELDNKPYFNGTIDLTTW